MWSWLHVCFSLPTASSSDWIILCVIQAHSHSHAAFMAVVQWLPRTSISVWISASPNGGRAVFAHASQSRILHVLSTSGLQDKCVTTMQCVWPVWPVQCRLVAQRQGKAIKGDRDAELGAVVAP